MAAAARMRTGLGMAYSRRSPWFPAALALATAACDPLVDVAGAFFPAWIVCILVAVAVTIALRYLFAHIGLERYLGAPMLVYPSLATAIAFACWVVFYRR
jgi:hypothetical protein